MFSWAAADKAHPTNLAQAKLEMWQARRLVYLVASRTNVFLYFILPPGTPPDLVAEFNTMFAQLGRHPEQASPSGTLWELRVSKLGDIETLDDYLDAIEAETVAPPPPGPPPVHDETALPEQTEPAEPSEPAPDSALAEAPVLAEVSPSAAITIEAEVSPTTEEPATPAPEPAPSAGSKSDTVTVTDLAAELGLPVDEVIIRLRRQGFRGITPRDRISRQGMLSALHLTPPAAFNSLAGPLDKLFPKTDSATNPSKTNSGQ